MIRSAVTLTGVFLLAGCMPSLKDVGQTPKLSRVGYGLAGEGVQSPLHPVSKDPRHNRFSIWNNERGDLFTDKLALKPGDILTVEVAINDNAQLTNKSDSARTVGRGIDLGGQYSIAGVGSDANADAEVDSKSDFKGTGGTARSESISLSVAAIVTRVLQNGNLLVRGSQEVRVNAEVRVLTIAGIVRPNDIGPNNTISYERIAEARVSYGGRGHISRVQKPPYGQDFLDRVLPF